MKIKIFNTEAIPNENNSIESEINKFIGRKDIQVIHITPTESQYGDDYFSYTILVQYILTGDGVNDK